jgi:LacI family transcriptional regulator
VVKIIKKNSKNKSKNKKTTITIRDVARMAGVSATTVSHALSGERYVKEETIQKILKIIKDNKYKPNIIARSLSKKTTRTLGVILPDINNYIYTKILKGVEEETAKDDYILIISSTYFNDDAEVNQIERLNALFADGLLFIGGTKDIKHIKKANVRNLPVILVYRWTEDSRYPKVLINNKKAIIGAVNFLSSLGHQKIGYIGWLDDEFIISIDKYAGYLEGLKNNKIKPNNKNIFLKKGKMQDGHKEAHNMINDYLKTNKKIDISALICKNDYIALGALEAFQLNNIVIPKDLSILSFGNLDVSEHSNPKLSTISLPLEQMGKTAAKMLIDSINQKEVKKEIILLDTIILQRETTQNLVPIVR